MSLPKKQPHNAKKKQTVSPKVDAARLNQQMILIALRSLSFDEESAKTPLRVYAKGVNRKESRIVVENALSGKFLNDVMPILMQLKAKREELEKISASVSRPAQKKMEADRKKLEREQVAIQKSLAVLCLKPIRSESIAAVFRGLIRKMSDSGDLRADDLLPLAPQGTISAGALKNFLQKRLEKVLRPKA